MATTLSPDTVDLLHALAPQNVGQLAEAAVRPVAMLSLRLVADKPESALRASAYRRQRLDRVQVTYPRTRPC
jgi:hypothetical protein